MIRVNLNACSASGVVTDSHADASPGSSALATIIPSGINSSIAR